MNYGVKIWVTADGRQLHSILITQDFAATVETGNAHPCHTILEKMEWLKIKHKHDFELTLYAFLSLQKSPLLGTLPSINDVSVTNTRHRDCVCPGSSVTR